MSQRVKKIVSIKDIWVQKGNLITSPFNRLLWYTEYLPGINVNVILANYRRCQYFLLLTIFCYIASEFRKLTKKFILNANNPILVSRSNTSNMTFIESLFIYCRWVENMSWYSSIVEKWLCMPCVYEQCVIENKSWFNRCLLATMTPLIAMIVQWRVFYVTHPIFVWFVNTLLKPFFTKPINPGNLHA